MEDNVYPGLPIPLELVMNIFEYVGFLDHLCIQTVCKAWYRIIDALLATIQYFDFPKYSNLNKFANWLHRLPNLKTLNLSSQFLEFPDIELFFRNITSILRDGHRHFYIKSHSGNMVSLPNLTEII